MTTLSETIACTLHAGNLKAQGERWRELSRSHGIERIETEHGLRVSFENAAGVEDELRALVAVENECCSWAQWSVEVDGDTVVMNARSTAGGIATLHGMFTRLELPPRR